MDEPCRLVCPPQLALPGDPLMSLEIALDAVGGLPAFRGSVANNAVLSGRRVGDAGRAAKTDRLADSEFVVVHADPHASRLTTGRPSAVGDAPKLASVPD
jgi:hypothetical protein